MNYNTTPAKQKIGRSLVFSLLMLGSSVVGFSQTASLSTHAKLTSDTTGINTPDTLIVTVKNIGSTSYTGFWDINFSTSADTSPVLGCVVPTVTLTPNGLDSATSTCIITFLFDSTHFHPGYNIIVVWSSGNARTAADSVSILVYLDSTTMAVHEYKKNTDLKIYPSITNDFINVESTGNTFPLKIFIADVSGRIINMVSPAPDSKNRIKINTSELSAGIYFIDMLMPDKSRVVSKFVKEE